MTTRLSSQDVMRQLLADPATIERLAREHLDKQRQAKDARDAFIASPTFTGMLAMLTDAPEGLGFDNEELAYFPEQVVQRVWQNRYTVADTERLLDVLTHPSDAEVPPDSKTTDPELLFFNQRYTFHGVMVSILSGQGTIVAVHNRPLIGPRSQP